MNKKNRLLNATKKSTQYLDDKVLNGKKYIDSIDVDLINDNPYQPRFTVDDKELDELSKTIKNDGLLQPISLAKIDDEYILIAGQRRLLAHKKLGLKEIKAIVLPDIDDNKLITLSLMENIQRVNLSYIETAIQYNYVISKKLFTVKELSQELGKDESDIRKTIKLLNLSPKIIDDLKLHNNIKDLKILDAIRSLGNFKLQESTYEWYIETNPTRLELIQKIKDLKDDKIKDLKDDKPYNIKNGKNSCIVKLPHLSSDKLKKIDEFIKSLI